MSDNPNVHASDTYKTIESDKEPLHPGPYPRNAAETAWKTSAFREALFSVMRGNELVTGMLLAKEGFGQAVRELWKSIELKKVDEKKDASNSADRVLLYSTAVRSIDCGMDPVFDKPSAIIALLLRYPCSTHVFTEKHSLRLTRSGLNSYTNVNLLSEVCFSSHTITTCTAPSLPTAIPSDWSITRRYRVVVGDRISPADATILATSAVKAWTGGVGIFADSVDSLHIRCVPSLELLNLNEWNLTANIPALTAFSLELVGVKRKKLSELWVNLGSGNIGHIDIRTTADGENLFDIEDFCHARWRTHNARSIASDIGPFRHMCGRDHIRHTWELYKTPLYPDFHVEAASPRSWNDLPDSPRMDRLNLRMDGRFTNTFEMITTFSYIAEGLLKVGGPLCEYTLQLKPTARDDTLVTRLLTRVLRREINVVIVRLRETRAPGWSRKVKEVSLGTKRKGEEMFGKREKIQRRLSF